MSTRTLKYYDPHLSKLIAEAGKISGAKRTPRLSKAFQEALYAYTLAILPYQKPTRAEEKIFKEGMEEFENGEFITLEQWENDLDSIHKTKSTKTSR